MPTTVTTPRATDETMVTLYRICADGDGSHGEAQPAHPGRWNEADTPVWYCAQSIALAVLEVLQSDHREGPPGRRHVCRVLLPLAVFAARRQGPVDLMEEDASRRYGTRWARSGASLLLEVPSHVVPWESNFVLNPAHPDFGAVSVESIGCLLPEGRAQPHPGPRGRAREAGDPRHA